jgi:hypothetical protein
VTLKWTDFTLLSFPGVSTFQSPTRIGNFPLGSDSMSIYPYFDISYFDCPNSRLPKLAQWPGQRMRGSMLIDGYRGNAWSRRLESIIRFWIMLRGTLAWECGTRGWETYHGSGFHRDRLA